MAFDIFSKALSVLATPKWFKTGFWIDHDHLRLTDCPCQICPEILLLPEGEGILLYVTAQ